MPRQPGEPLVSRRAPSSRRRALFLVRYPRLAPVLGGLARRFLLLVAAVQGVLARILSGLGLEGVGGVVRRRSELLRGVAGWLRGISPWLARHRTYVSRAREGGIDVLFVGDSLTYGWRQEGAAPWRERFAELNAENFGIGGDRTRFVLSRLACGELDGISPSVIVLLIGANDVRTDPAEDVADGIAAIIDVIREHAPGSRVLLLSLLPQDRLPTERRARIARVNELIAGLDDGEAVRYLDVSGRFLDPEGLISERVMSDFLHLTPRGYEILADALHPVLLEMTGRAAATERGTDRMQG